MFDDFDVEAAKTESNAPADTSKLGEAAEQLEADLFADHLLFITEDVIKSLVLSSQEIASLAEAHVGNPTAESKEAYREALATHFETVAKIARKRSLNIKIGYSPIQIKSDQILSKIEVAELNAKITQDNPSVKPDGGTNITLAQLEEHLKSLPNRSIPNLSSNWSQRSAWDKYQLELEAAIATAEQYARGFNLPERSGKLAAIKRTAVSRVDPFNISPRTPEYSEATGPDGTLLKVFHYPVDDLFVADSREIEVTAKIIDKIASIINLPKGVKYSLVGSAVGSAIKGSRVLGYANRVLGGHSIVNTIRKQERVDKKTLKPFVENKSWHSTHTHAGVGSYFSHTAAHEVGHVVAYDVWPNESDMDRDLAPLRPEQVSFYGNESAHEFFAESFAKYILTGKGTPAFIDLLRDKGLLKSQQSN